MAEGDAALPAVRAGFLELPPPFFIGTGTSAYQVEGAAFQGGRWPSVWDEFARQPNNTYEGHNGDVACDHYHRFKTDVAIMAHLGLHAYRFSISWSRIIPDGEGEVNEEGVAFYSALLDELEANGITPIVTLFHWDLPSALEHSFGGWHGPKEQIVEAFADFARTCFLRFGRRVRHWLTLNEPACVAVYGHCLGEHAPGQTDNAGSRAYEVAHNLLLAHAEAVRIFREEFREFEGQIGIALNVHGLMPMDPSSKEDAETTERALDFMLGWFAEPLVSGDYPASMRKACGSRLPSFTEKQKAALKGSADFLGINYYSTALTKKGNPHPEKTSGFWVDMNVMIPVFKDPDWIITGNKWPIVPCGLRDILVLIHKRYPCPGGIVVTENGASCESDESLKADMLPGALQPKEYQASTCPPEDFEETMQDPLRVRFLRAHLAAVHAAISKGADVRGYIAWSTLDNFEWRDGYKQRFGIVHVDFPTQRRTIKASARFLGEAARRQGFEAPPRAEQFPGAAW